MKDRALAISTICCLATVSSPTSVRGSSLRFSRVEQRGGVAVQRLVVEQEPAPRGSRPMKMFCATVRSVIRLSSWWMMLMPSSCAARAVRSRPACRR